MAMSPDLLLPLIAYAFVTSITPGPNNMMLLASGVNYGFRRTLPHLCGVSLGLAPMLVGIGLGLGRLFARVPLLYSILHWVGMAYLLWLAWKIARSGAVSGTERKQVPLSFLQAAAFQWLNPKCWMMVFGALTTYLPSQWHIDALLTLTLVFVLVNVPCVASWAGLGKICRQFLSNPRAARIFNFVMAALLVTSLRPFKFDSNLF
ncbi:MAG: LysE family translocator [Betaproteobacteria bacterium]|nr:LysE family translocator [Betaproteobacteria bacterium]